jgi:hypothetical protein
MVSTYHDVLYLYLSRVLSRGTKVHIIWREELCLVPRQKQVAHPTNTPKINQFIHNHLHLHRLAHRLNIATRPPGRAPPTILNEGNTRYTETKQRRIASKHIDG